ncbi:ATP-dependent DNA helicase RecQ [Flavobacterium beibuense F44-8]|uniref:ATP-dependent DNA helicase RecQ n=1 Tax=Flavobacterium beibuense F44-8 TaxID=1406840 RepID=A0A0A2LYW5_9FLAO|nr:ATP-dependent DNA helicase RecQ [Flavobacterium beibuense]KGO84418.1 ATP-dependent DNA helicase RecQ [Flavobacterium beibuense F44-8]
MQQPLDILSKYWKYESFRDPQEQIIQSVLNGKDTLAVMPTGGGKSVCFQVPGMMLPGLCLVVSPLVALMKDQVENLSRIGIRAIALTGGISTDEISDLLDNCRYGNYKFLYLSPERLQADWILERIKELPINLVAIDEAHCVSQWGHDFRPAYLKVSVLKKYLPNVPFMALTASATKRVREDMIKHLELHDPAVFIKSFARKNLAYMVFEAEDKLRRIQQMLVKNPQPSIIYVRNRKACYDVSRQLESLGFRATFYHGGLTSSEKQKNMQLWMSEQAQVMVATNAFGMGIDKPNVRTVIHIQLLDNMESYYQEAGRAGRNNEKAFAVLLVNKADTQIGKNQFLEVLPDKKFLKQVYVRLNNYLQIAYGEGINESFAFNLNIFCRQYDLPVVKTYNALQFLDRQGIVTLSKEFSEKVTIQFLIPSKEVMRYISLNRNDEEAILTILRSYPGVFDMETSLNTDLIVRKAKISEEELMQVLKRLHEKEVISFRSLGNDSKLTFNEVREDELTINRVAKFLEKQNNIKTQQFDAVISYIENLQTCKSRLILTYFDEEATQDCGICSYCIAKNKKVKDPSQVALQVLELISSEALSSRDIEEKLELTPDEVIFVIQILLENDKIKINTNNQYILK